MIVCKACRSPSAQSFYRLDRAPVFLNKLYDTRAKALACPTAAIDLVACGRCGFVFNAAFQDALMDYDALYVQSQGHSQQFRRYTEALAGDFVAAMPDKAAKVVEIGCGKEAYFLKMLMARGVDVRGFDPLYDGDNPRVTRAFFDKDSARGVEADVVLMRLFLYLLEYPFDFLARLKAFLRPETRVYIETPRFEHTLAAGAFWDVSHEVCDYFTEAFFQRAFSGTAAIRTTFSSQYMVVDARLGDLVEAFPDPDRPARVFVDFNDCLMRCRGVLHDHRRNIVWGAGSKGGAFAVSLDPDATLVEAVVDINPAKQGRFMPLSGHPCVGPDDIDWAGLGEEACLWIMNENYKSEILASIPDYKRGHVIVLDEVGRPQWSGAEL